MGSSEKMVVAVGDITKLAVDAIVNAATVRYWVGAGWTVPSTRPPGRDCSKNAAP